MDFHDNDIYSFKIVGKIGGDYSPTLHLVGPQYWESEKVVKSFPW